MVGHVGALVRSFVLLYVPPEKKTYGERKAIDSLQLPTT